MDSAQLPDDIVTIIAWIADFANSYGSTLKLNEVDRFKSDLMLRRDQPWLPDRVPPAAFRQGCIDAGLSPVDTAKLSTCSDDARAGDASSWVAGFQRLHIRRSCR